MTLLTKGRYLARWATNDADFDAAYALRATVFTTDRDNPPDPFDALCRHVLVEDLQTDQVLCTFRLMPLGGCDILRSYSAQYYNLAALESYPGKMVELGRFCLAPDCHDPDILRVAWGALTRIVDQDGVDLLFGCASFHGTDAATHADAFAMLHDRHIAPLRWRPRVKARQIFSLARALSRPFDRRRAMAAMPPMLKTYLTMGGWVSDHAVFDHQMGTMHVFTGVEVRAIPKSRARLLRAIAG